MNPAIHQFHSGSAYGDAVTNGMFFIQKILKNLGFKSEIFVQFIDKKLKGNLKLYKSYKGSPENVLIIHHSLGHDLIEWLLNLPDRKILVYHNITPEKFFPENSSLKYWAKIGKEQLKIFKNYVEFAIADSEINKQELLKAGFDEQKIEVIPLLFDFTEWEKIKYDYKILDRYKNFFNIIFVGRIVENKKQDEVIKVFNLFKQLFSKKKSKLILIGGITSETYFSKLKQLVKELGLEEDVIFTGKVSNSELKSYYKIGDAFLCLSEHEGFCVPIIESFYYNVPVIAYDAPGSNIKYTMNKGGILFKEKNLEYIAATLVLLGENRKFRREILKTQHRALQKYEPQNLINKFIEVLEKLKIKVSKEKKISFLKKYQSFKTQFKNRIKIQIEGPFDSSYSLALVNREVALALEEILPGKISLFSTEGPGDFEPNKKFLNKFPKVKELWKRSEKIFKDGIIMRNLYPPRVHDARGIINILHSYGWEESEFPKEFLEDFNTFLDGITVMSPFVKKILIDNGIFLPVVVTPLGGDHIFKIKSKKFQLKTKKRFKFLHISSAFPRKGVDILLKAYAKAFTKNDDVCLVIKTFPNPHNEIENLIKRYLNFSNAPEVEVINKDISYEELVGLYHECDVLVQPTRGEGFGLPMLEAMLLEKPVITTGYGGQNIFCTPKTAWLLNFSFKKAKTHMNLPFSYWIEPDEKDLIEKMRFLFNFKKNKEATNKVKLAKRVAQKFTWKKNAEKLIKFCTLIHKLPVFLKEKIDLAWISTWNTKCGIAEYSKYLINYLKREEKFNIKIFANKVSQDQIVDDKEEEEIARVWTMGNKNIKSLIKELLSHNFDAVVIQYNFGFFPVECLEEIIKVLKKKKIRIFITFHSVKDINKKDYKASLKWIKDWLKTVDRIFVHSIKDLNYLKNFGIYQNVALFPHGIEPTSFSLEEQQKIKNSLLLQNKKVVASFGFLLPHKGIKELIKAFFYIQRILPDSHLLLLNALYPIPSSQKYLEECKNLINELNLKNKVTFITDFLPELEIKKYLSIADVIVFPYQHTQESSSAAVRYALALKKTAVCTPLDIFEDVEDVVIFTSDFSPKEIGKTILEVLKKEKKINSLNLEKWIKTSSWENVAKRLSNIIQYFTLYSYLKV